MQASCRAVVPRAAWTFIGGDANRRSRHYRMEASSVEEDRIRLLGCWTSAVAREWERPDDPVPMSDASGLPETNTFNMFPNTLDSMC